MNASTLIPRLLLDTLCVIEIFYFSGISKRVITTIIKEKDVDLSKLADRLVGVLSSGLVQRIRVNFSWFTAHDWLEFLITGAVYGLQELIDADTLRIVQLLREAIEIYLRR